LEDFSMTKWEYEFLDCVALASQSTVKAALNKLGDEGWEVVSSVTPGFFVLKRPKPAEHLGDGVSSSLVMTNNPVTATVPISTRDDGGLPTPHFDPPKG
jgi:hypothetical protein